MIVRAVAVVLAVVAAAVGAQALTTEAGAPPQATLPTADRLPPRDPPPHPTLPAPAPAESAPAPAVTRRWEPIRWRRSRSLGLPWDGRLVRGVQLPPEGALYFTWDPVLRRTPNRPWRRVGSDRLLRTLLRVLADFAAANPDAPRIGIGDLSRPNGGDFGVTYGRPGHVSHQNGVDADVYYPRLDRRERAPRRVAQVDRRLAQDLVDRFVAAGAKFVFVGPNTGLSGPPQVVQPLARHDDHLHVRLR